MNSKTIILSILLVASVTVGYAAGQKKYSLASPDGRNVVEISVGDEITYRVANGGEVVLESQPVQIKLGGGKVLGQDATVRKIDRRSGNNVIPSPVYKKNEVEDRFNELAIHFREGFSLTFRAMDDGVAYRFSTSFREPFIVKAEPFGITLPEGTNAYIPYVRGSDKKNIEAQFFNSFEQRYTYSPLTEWKDLEMAFMPVLFETPAGIKICVTEADLLDYPGMYLLNPDGGRTVTGMFAPVPELVEQGGHNQLQGLVKSRKDHIAECRPATDFPWRVFVIARDDVELLDNDMVFRLATPPDPAEDFSWVKPGKVAWDWWNAWNLYGVDFRAGINNETYRYYIDFASQNGIEYVILDEGWSVKNEADLLKVIPALDLPGLVEYASDRGVDLILWAGYLAFDRDMENVCRHYSEMGIKGFKVDFMDRDDQPMVDFHRRAAEMGVKYKLLMDFHGTYKPTGLHRTYPNVINYEGVFGLEQMKWSKENVDQVTYDVTMPFIRMVAGPLDYTQGAMRNAVKNNYRPVSSEAMSQGTRCRQLAQYVVFESPLNMLCDSPSNYMREEECLGFITAVPTVWDQTVALSGKIGEHIVIARRSGNTWYVGGMTDWTRRELEVDLSFLGEGNYRVEIFRDGINADRAARDYVREEAPVPADRKMKIRLAPGGGFALKIIAV